MSESHHQTPQEPPGGDGRADVLANEPRPRRHGRLIAWSTVAVLSAAALGGGGYALAVRSGGGYLAATQGGGSGSTGAGVVAQANAAAAAPSTGPSNRPSTSPNGPHARRGPLAGGFGLLGPHQGLGLGRVLHGEVTVTTADGGTRLVDVQRGSVSAIDGNTVTVTSTDKVSFGYVIDAKTRIVDFDLAKPRMATVADVKVGDTVRVVAIRSGETRTATLVVTGQPKDRPGARPHAQPSTDPSA